MAARGRKSGIILIVLALVVILGAAAVYYLVTNGMPAQASPIEEQATDTPQQQAQVSMGQIVIASQNINRGRELTEEVLVTIPYPEEEISQGVFFSNIDEVVGMRAREDISARVPLTQAMLVAQEDVLAKNPSFDIPDGFTAASMPMYSLTSASNRVMEGDHVMVIGCMLMVDLDTDFQTTTPNQVAPVTAPYTPPAGPTTATITIAGSEGGSPPRGRVEMDNGLGLPVYVIPGEQFQRPRLVCQTMISDAVVLGVGKYEEPVEIVQAPQATTDELAAEAQPQQAVEQPVEVEEEDLEVTLVVTPQDAVTLNYMMLSGVKLSMALRNPVDRDPISTQAVTLQYLMDQKVIPLPAKLPYGMEPKVDVLRFPDEPAPPPAAVE